MEQRVYRGVIDPTTLADHLVGVFNQHSGQGMYYNHHHTMAQRVGEGDQVLVQIVRAGSWGQNGGTLGVSIAKIPDGISVGMGESNWLDLDGSTVAGMVVGALIFPPLLLLPLLAGLVGSTFNQDVWDVIDRYCSWVTARPEQPNVPNYFRCPYCGAYNQPGIVQCFSCHGPFNNAKPQPPRRAASAQATPEPQRPARKQTAPLSPPVLEVEPQPEPEVTPFEPQPEISDGPAAESVVCPACGETVAAARFCGNCATRLR